MLETILILIAGITIGFFIGVAGAVWFLKKQLRKINPTDMIQNVMGQMFGVDDDKFKDEMKDKQTYDDWIK